MGMEKCIGGHGYTVRTKVKKRTIIQMIRRVSTINSNLPTSFSITQVTGPMAKCMVLEASILDRLFKGKILET